ncbi:MAG TPA: GPP34 family phosphoprotein [Chloroflexota bacterium]|nr:GPP34 family phosphoprotein [Chloroflexota bacterium]
MLTLAEELLLLALHDRSGDLIPSAAEALPTALASAVLMELNVRERLRAEGDDLVLADTSPTGDSILDQAAARIGRESRARDAGYWVNALAGEMRDLRDHLLDRLVTAGILRREEKRILWVFRSERFPLADEDEERQIRERIRAVVLEGTNAEPRTTALIALVEACALVDELFSPAERAEAQRRVRELVGGDVAQIGGAGGVQDALMRSLIVATLASTMMSMSGLREDLDSDLDWDSDAD